MTTIVTTAARVAIVAVATVLALAAGLVLSGVLDAEAGTAERPPPSAEPAG